MAIIKEWQRKDIQKCLKELKKLKRDGQRIYIGNRCKREWLACLNAEWAHIELARKHHKRALTWQRRFYKATGQIVKGK